jgi:hypothetical protein
MQNKKENSRQKLCEIQQLDESMAKSKTTYFSLMDPGLKQVVRFLEVVINLWSVSTYTQNECQSISRQKRTVSVTEESEAQKVSREAEFLDVIRTKVLRIFLLVFSATSTRRVYSPSPLSKTGL